MTDSTFDYEIISKRYAKGIPCPDDFSFPSHVLDKWATNPTQLALHWISHDFKVEKKLTYAQLSELSKKAAVVFENVGIKKGDRVLLQLPRVIEWWIILLGLMRMGAVVVPGTALLVAKGPLSFKFLPNGWRQRLIYVGRQISRRELLQQGQ